MDAYSAAFPSTGTSGRLLPDTWRLYKLPAAVQYWNSYFETDGPIRKLESAVRLDRTGGLGRGTSRARSRRSATAATTGMARTSGGG